MLKNYNYTRYYWLLGIAILLFVLPSGCSKDEGEPSAPPELSVEFNKGSAVFAWDTQGKFLLVNVPDNYKWKLQITFPEGEPQGWTRAAHTEGVGPLSVWVAVDNNYIGKREAVITVTLEATGASVSLPITQYGNNDDQGGDDGGGDGGDGGGSANLKAMELPQVTDIEWFLTYTPGEFSLEYAPLKKHSKWVAWRLHRGCIGSSGRTDAWQFDPRIPSAYQPTRQDFSGYDRGHLCPSGDRTQSAAMNRQTFMYSNMTPQNSNLNQNVWVDIENRERAWVSGYDTLYICAGGTVLKDADISGYTSPSAMAVPKYNFKVILRKKAATGTYDAIGFWFENRSYSPQTKVSVTQVKTVRQIEALTGINFYYNLPQNIQDEVENQFNPSAWGIN